MSGIWSIPRRASNADAALAVGELPGRLAEISSQQKTSLLLHFVDASGRLHAWLFDQSGLVASGATDGPYAGLGRVRSAMRVDSRAATRAPQPRRGPPLPPPPPAPPSSPVGDELARAAAQLFPGQVGSALSAGGGRLLVLSAWDTGAAPLAALPLAGETRLVDRWSTLVLPDLWALLDKGRSFDIRNLRLANALVVGDPDLSGDPEYRWQPLPAARAEAVEVGEMLQLEQPRLLLGAQATRTAVLEHLGRAEGPDLIYMATHGLANSVNPMDGSFLGLAGGHLYGRDLRSRRFEHWSYRHPLVVLSACQSALGRTFEGGAYGLARAWISAGAAQVVASLWNVDDEATRLLMTRFTDKLWIGMTPEEALRSAQRHASTIYKDDPGAWASFSVMGVPATRRA